MTLTRAVYIAEGFSCEGVKVTNELVLQAWQTLIDTGVVWHLQGWFARTAQDLINKRLLHARPPVRQPTDSFTYTRRRH